MRLLDLTFSEPEMNLALDEALLEEAEETGWQAGHSVGETLRFWEPAATMVVIGRSSSLQKEVNLEFCQQNSIPVMRRCSGGATIVTAPGCLMYGLLIPYAGREELKSLDNAHQFVMVRMIQAIAQLGIDVEWEGTCDLTIEGKKVSGNSLRCRRQGFLYHGTMICRNFDLDLVTSATHFPQRQPEYRNGRPHQEFLTQLPCTVTELKGAIQNQWQANKPLDAWPQLRTFDLARSKYSSSQWTHQIG